MSPLSPFCRLRMTKFRLKMDMSQFFDDERTLVYILVDPKWEQVHCLQEHVEQLFDVPLVHFLTDDGVYLPPKESIDIVRSGDVLRAIVPHKIKKKKKKTRSDGIGDEAGEENSMEVEMEKRRCDDRLTSSTPHRQPHKKQKIAVDVTRFVMEKSEDVRERKVSPKMQQSTMTTDTVTSTNNTHEGEKSELQESAGQPTEEIDETAKSRKRKRNRKKKKTGNDSKKAAKSPRLSTVPVPISSSTLRLSKSMSTPKKSVQHVHFDESATVEEQSPERNGKRVIFRCHLNTEGVLEPREIEAKEDEEGETAAKKPKIQIHENIVLVKANDVSNEEEKHDSSVIEVNDSTLRPEREEKQQEVVESTDFEDPVQGPQRSINVEAVLPYSEPMVGLPDVGDIVLFKMYRLDEGSTPGVSEYICGRCEDVDANLRTMICFVLDGHDQIDELPKLTQPDENGIIPDGETNCISLFLDELLDKKIFRMS